MIFSYVVIFIFSLAFFLVSSEIPWFILSAWTILILVILWKTMVIYAERPITKLDQPVDDQMMEDFILQLEQEQRGWQPIRKDL